MDVWGGSWLPSVKPKGGTDTRKEGDRHTRGVDWPTRKESGQAASGKRPRKEESGKRGDETSGQQKTPQASTYGA